MTHPVRAAHRTATLLVPVGVLGAAGALAIGRGTPPVVVIPTALVVAVIVVGIVAARRALRRASARIETILREETGHPAAWPAVDAPPVSGGKQPPDV